MKDITVTSKRFELLDIINNALKSTADTLGIKTFIENDGDEKKIRYDVPDKYFHSFQGKLKEVLSTSVLFDAKRTLYTAHLPKNVEKEHAFLLLHLLIMSDFYVSKSLLLASLSDFSEYNIDGIKNFLLKDEEEEWSAIAFAIKKSEELLTDKKELKKLIKCIASTVERKEDVLYIIDAETPRIVNCDLKEKSYSFKALEKELSYGEEMIAIIAENMPKKIAVYSQKLPKSVNCALRMIF